MVEFKLFNIPVKVEPIFWITLGLLGFLMFGINTTANILMMALFVIAAFISILVHELGHALTIRHYKLPTQITLSSFGGYASYPAGYLNRKQSFIVTLAGPLVQALLGGMLFLVTEFAPLPSNLFTFFIYITMLISVIWALFNCLPVLPLDGGRMLEAAMGPRRQKTTYLISGLVAVVAGTIGALNGYYFAAMFMGMFAYQSYQAYQRHNF